MLSLTDLTTTKVNDDSIIDIISEDLIGKLFLYEVDQLGFIKEGIGAYPAEQLTDDKIRIKIGIDIGGDTIEKDKLVNVSSIIEQYYQSRDDLYQKLVEVFEPTISQEDIVSYTSLSSEKYLIHGENTLITLNVEGSYKEQPSIRVEIILTLDIQVEIISITEQQDYYRDQWIQLCQTDNMITTLELLEWGTSIGIPDIETLSKDELCEEIRKHYQF